MAEAKTSATTTRLQRGLALGRERFEEITRVAPWTWSVPSCSGHGAYAVDLKAAGGLATCSCADRTPSPEECKHVSAARYVKAKTATCSGCGKRCRHRELVEAGGESLTFFEGDLVCQECASAHGVS
jgi:hypothetical protein